MADEYGIPEAIADALDLEHIRMEAGELFVWDLLERLAAASPFVTVGELHEALALHRDRYSAAMAAMDCLPTVPAPDAMQ